MMQARPTKTYPTGETVTPGYSSTGWLTGLTTSAGGTTTLASNLTYSGLAGAAGQAQFHECGQWHLHLQCQL